MRSESLLQGLDASGTGETVHTLMRELFPICRSITGNGVRQTLKAIGKLVPLEVHEVPTGKKVFDWDIPWEWNVRDAFVRTPGGKRIIDFQKSNLHLLNYSVPVRKTVTLSELQNHLFTLPEHPEWIPYKTSYYEERWGFCLSHKQLLSLEDGDYEVCVDSTLSKGHLTYGELLLPGAEKSEVLISTHICHPSLANDNLSGVCIATFLAKRLAAARRRYSYRFLFIPGTIGAVTWLCLNQRSTARIKSGLVVCGVGDPGTITYKKSRQGNAEIDQVVQHVLGEWGMGGAVRDFSPYGYDERQYCSHAHPSPNILNTIPQRTI
jgi:aminopeptidase-like protein